MAVSEAESPRSAEPQGGVQVIARVGQVLRALDGENKGLSLAQLANRIGLPRSTVHRIVTALAAEGMVATASAAGRVRIGPEFARLSSYSHADLWSPVEPFMRRIFDEIGETVVRGLSGLTVAVSIPTPAQRFYGRESTLRDALLRWAQQVEGELGGPAEPDVSGQRRATAIAD